MSLRALVLGSGFAGQGHAAALRDAGVEIVGMASRTQAVVEQVAGEMGIPYAATDWQQALLDLQPDIVAVGTPGGAHFEPVMAALEQGCHVLCDKPLAARADQARLMARKAEEAGVKTAYAASYRTMPHVLLARELVMQDEIGDPLEVECVSHFNLNPLIPFGWSHRLEQGGGRLNNNFTHKLSVVLHILAGRVTAVGGTTRSDMTRAPIVDGVHHFRQRHSFAPESGDDPGLTWAEVDAEWSYTALARIELQRPTRQPVSAMFHHSGLQPRFHPDYIAIYGSKAAIYIEGHYGHGPLFLQPRRGEWEEIPLPAHILDRQPDIADDTQRNWTILARDFAADIRGEDHSDYQTFRDGWIYQEIIEAIRAETGWSDMTSLYEEGA